MNLIDNTYFVDDISLPGLTTSGSKNVGMDKLIDDLTIGGLSLTRFIKKYQTEYLNGLLGKKIAEAFVKGLLEIDNEIWINLKNQLIDDELKQSPIANYVYFFIMRYGLTFTTSKGEKKGKSDYAIAVSSRKPEFAWNRMVEMNFEIVNWFAKNQKDYESFIDDNSLDDDLFTPINLWI